MSCHSDATSPKEDTRLNCSVPSTFAICLPSSADPLPHLFTFAKEKCEFVSFDEAQQKITAIRPTSFPHVAFTFELSVRESVNCFTEIDSEWRNPSPIYREALQHCGKIVVLQATFFTILNKSDCSEKVDGKDCGGCSEEGNGSGKESKGDCGEESKDRGKQSKDCGEDGLSEMQDKVEEKGDTTEDVSMSGSELDENSRTIDPVSMSDTEKSEDTPTAKKDDCVEDVECPRMCFRGEIPLAQFQAQIIVLIEILQRILGSNSAGEGEDAPIVLDVSASRIFPLEKLRLCREVLPDINECISVFAVADDGYVWVHTSGLSRFLPIRMEFELLGVPQEKAQMAAAVINATCLSAIFQGSPTYVPKKKFVYTQLRSTDPLLRSWAAPHTVGSPPIKDCVGFALKERMERNLYEGFVLNLNPPLDVLTEHYGIPAEQCVSSVFVDNVDGGKQGPPVYCSFDSFDQQVFMHQCLVKILKLARLFWNLDKKNNKSSWEFAVKIRVEADNGVREHMWFQLRDFNEDYSMVQAEFSMPYDRLGLKSGDLAWYESSMVTGAFIAESPYGCFSFFNIPRLFHWLGDDQ